MNKNWDMQLKADRIKQQKFYRIDERVRCYWDTYLSDKDQPAQRIEQPQPSEDVTGQDIRYIQNHHLSALLCLYRSDGTECTVSKQGYRCIKRSLPFRGHYHTHHYIEILYVVKGSFQQILLGEPVTFTTGDFAITDQNISHADLITGEEDSAVLFLGLESDYLHSLLGQDPEANPLFSYFLRALQIQQNLQSYLHLKCQQTPPEIPFLLEQLTAEEQWMRPGADALISGYLIRLFSYLSRDYTQTLHESDHQTREQVLLYEVERYIHLHYDHVTSQELEQVFHYHRNYYNLLLKKYRNVSFMEYVKQVRMQTAAELLTTSTLPIQKIAAMVGYQNSSFFYHTFASFHHETPREYRNSHSISVSPNPPAFLPPENPQNQ